MFKYLTSKQEPEVSVVDVSQKVFDEIHLLPDEKTREPVPTVTRQVDVDAIIQAGAPLCLDLNKLMEHDPVTAETLRQPWEAGSDVIDAGAATTLKESIKSIRDANAQAKAKGYDSIDAYVQALVKEAISKQEAANASEKGDN